MGESSAIEQIFNFDQSVFASSFLFVWLTMWTIGGLLAATALLWNVAGYEIIRVDKGALEIGWHLIGLERTRKYDVNEIRYLNLNPKESGDFWGGRRRDLFGLMGGVVKFDYGMKTCKFGVGIDEAEGRLLIETFKINPNFKEENFA